MPPEIVGTTAAYAIGVPLVLVLIAIEASYSAANGLRLYKQPDTLGTLGLLAGNILVNGVIKSSVFVLSLYLYQFRLLDLGALLPLWALWILTFFAIDFVFYCFHRCSHRVRWLWAIHMNHHCSEELNFVVAFRQPWIAPIVKVPFFAVLPLVGFDPTITVVAGVIATLWGVVGHTRIVPKLWPPIEWLMNTPSHHRVHHGSNPQYIDKNYGNIFIIWDRIFGTFEQEQEPVQYGLRTNINTQNPFAITAYDWKALFTKARQAQSLSVAWNYFWKPPGWHPQTNDSVNHASAESR